MFKKEIEKIVEEIKSEIIDLRRFFHMYPEVGFEEYKTSKKIQEELNKIGIPYEIKGKTGVIGFLDSKKTKTIGLRTDIDALPVKEETNLPFSSKNEGIMHACGHDGHIAVLIGIAKVISKFSEKLNYNIKFIFQPCEEKPPGGAIKLIEEGVLKDIDFLIGFHFLSDIPLFKLSIKKGIIMANTDKFQIIIEGKAGHASTPHLTYDPITCSSYIITNLQTIISRKISPFSPAVISIGKIFGGDAFNIIPDKVIIEGTVRTLSESIRRKIKKEIENVSKKIASIFKCKVKIIYDMYCPGVKNDKKLTEKIEKISRKILPSNYFYHISQRMGGEDFSFYSQIVPSTYILIGIGKKCGVHHSSKFILDEKILPFTIKYLSQLILNF